MKPILFSTLYGLSFRVVKKIFMKYIYIFNKKDIFSYQIPFPVPFNHILITPLYLRIPILK